MHTTTAIPGPIFLIGLAIILLAIATLTSCGVEYPVTLSVETEQGSVSYSDKGLKIEVQK